MCPSGIIANSRSIKLETEMPDTTRMIVRHLAARALAPLMRATGFRFSKNYRHGSTRFHRAVYALCSTVEANNLADRA